MSSLEAGILLLFERLITVGINRATTAVSLINAERTPAEAIRVSMRVILLFSVCLLNRWGNWSITPVLNKAADMINIAATVMVAELEKLANPSLTSKTPVTKKRTITPIEIDLWKNVL